MSPRASRAAAVAQAPRPLHVLLAVGTRADGGRFPARGGPGMARSRRRRCSSGTGQQPVRGVTAALAGGRLKARSERRGFRTLNPLLNVKPEEP